LAEWSQPNEQEACDLRKQPKHDGAVHETEPLDDYHWPRLWDDELGF